MHSCWSIKVCLHHTFEKRKFLEFNLRQFFWFSPKFYAQKFWVRTRNPLSFHSVHRQQCPISPDHVQSLLKSSINTYKHHIFFKNVLFYGKSNQIVMIYEHLLRIFFVAIYVLFPPILWPVKVNSAIFFAFRMYGIHVCKGFFLENLYCHNCS